MTHLRSSQGRSFGGQVRHSIRIVTLFLGVVILCGVAVVAASALTGSSVPLDGYVPPVIAELQPDPDRAPVVPSVTDGTKMAALPAGVGVGAIPPGVNRPVRTNNWWSSGILERWPAPLYPLPFKGVLSAGGLNLSVPRRRVENATVFAGDGDGLLIRGPRAGDEARAIIAGDWDVTFRVRERGRHQYDATFVQGSPFVFVRSPLRTLAVDLPAEAVTSAFPCERQCGSAVLVRTPRQSFLLVSPVRDAFDVRRNVVNVLFTPKHALLTVVAIAPGSDPKAYLSAAMRPYVRTTAEYFVAPSQVLTLFHVPEQTIMGLLPHHVTALPSDLGPVIGTFETVRGLLRLYGGNGFYTVLRRPSIIPSLPPISMRLTSDLTALLQEEILAQPTPQADAYFGAKDVYRTATLVELGDLLGREDLREQALERAEQVLAGFCTSLAGSPLKFGYDAAAGGIIAFPPAFGSEHYNDHHFHYGYFLHAAAIVGRTDPQFLQQYDDCFRLLIRDIASKDRNDPSFPYLRNFDPYGGHSWAGGLTLFLDANNQESVSEAAHAWYALALYGRTTGDRALEDLGTWLFAQESHAARTYWLDSQEGADTLPDEFGFPMISILWGGKADYATFFDPSDAAIRGIQFFPLTMSLLPMVDRNVTARIVSPIASRAERTIWTSGLRLVESLFNPNAYVAPEDPVDPGLSRTGAEYWQRAWRELGAPLGPLSSCAGYLFRKDNVLTAAAYRFPGDPELCTEAIGGQRVDLRLSLPGWNVMRML